MKERNGEGVRGRAGEEATVKLIFPNRPLAPSPPRRLAASPPRPLSLSLTRTFAFSSGTLTAR